MKTMSKYESDPNDALLWDFLQTNMSCCGVKTPQDWRYKLGGAKNFSTPDTCCLPAVRISACGHGALQDLMTTRIHASGCLDQLMNFVRSNLYIIGGVALGIALVELFGIIFACCLVSAVKE
jgi:hypothetical protein